MIKKAYYIVPLFIISIISFFPFYFTTMMATHNTEEIFKGDLLIPGNYLFDNIKTILDGGFHLYYWNSFYTAFLSAALCDIVSSMAGYSIAKLKFKHRKSIFIKIS